MLLSVTPFIHLASVAQVLDAEGVALGAENCADKEKGAYTGEVSAAMVRALVHSTLSSVTLSVASTTVRQQRF